MRRAVEWLSAVSVLSLVATAVQAQTIFEQTSWSRTVFYSTHWNTPATAGTLWVAAAGHHEIFLDGVRLGADSLATTASRYPVDLSEGDHTLGLTVSSLGADAGEGAVVFLDTDTMRVVTSDVLRQPWHWSPQLPATDDWLTQDVAGTDGWRLAQRGALLNRPAVLPADAPPAVAGYPGGIDAGGGALSLKHMAGENLALGRPSNRVSVVDGDLRSAWEAPVSSINFAASIDLQERRKIDRVRVLTAGPDYAANSVRGYSVQVSDDQIRWSEVGVVHDIGAVPATEVLFNPTFTRFVRVVIVDINAVSPPRIAEIQVFGEGIVESGQYLSPPLDLGVPGRKNLGIVSWEADVPARTFLALQFRSGDEEADFVDPEAGWSDAVTAPGILYPAQEPARLVQYRVLMETRDEERTPTLHSVRFDVGEQIVASDAAGSVRPRFVPMGVDTTFVYTLDVTEADGDAGIQQILIEVPSQAVVDETAVRGATLTGWSSTGSLLTLELGASPGGQWQLVVPFRARSFSSAHDFRVLLLGDDLSNPLNGRSATGVDDETGESKSWTVLTTTADVDVVSAVRANPAVISPNGDGVNDDAVIELILAKVDVPRSVEVDIHDLSGRRVRRLDVPDLSSGAYLRIPGQEPLSPAVWDGRDDDGNLVPPGTYLVRLRVELDNSDAVIVGSVAVVY